MTEARTAEDIYEEYKTMPELRLHQLSVAAVASVVCDHLKKPINKNKVILACLFHDMGNIIKSDLQLFPDLRKAEAQTYWQKVKAEYIEKYGNDAHSANVAIAREISLPQESVALIDAIGFSNLDRILSDISIEEKVCEYADLRVGPFGILSVEERLKEGRMRYATRVKRSHYYDSDEHFEMLVHTAQKLEQQVFDGLDFSPEEINDESIASNIKELQNYSVA